MLFSLNNTLQVLPECAHFIPKYLICKKRRWKLLGIIQANFVTKKKAKSFIVMYTVWVSGESKCKTSFSATTCKPEDLSTFRTNFIYEYPVYEDEFSNLLAKIAIKISIHFPIKEFPPFQQTGFN